MTKTTSKQFRTLDDQLIILANAIRDLQELARQHHAAITTITEMLEERADAHPPL